ncbi:MAG: N,N-diacetylchitobiose transport system substrate-binding protein, partial [Actinomycetota bacterium]|nr:N,N-diacetylchitobiose transport system substrate-binding protein [Actinomycetota bacterium]
LVLVSLPGCGVLTPSAGGSSATGPLQVWIMEPGAPELRAFFTSATNDFQAAHRGDRVEVQFVPWASAHDQFVTAIGGGQVPDVAEMGSTWTPEFGDIGALEPADLAGTGRYVQSLVDGATVDGKVYGIPWYAGARALIYRADVLAALGRSVPTTWDELLSVGRAVRDGAHMAAFGVAGNAEHYVLPMVWQNGGEIAYRKGGVWRSGMTSPAAVAAVQFYADLYRTEHFAPAGALSWNARDVRKAFEAGDLAMMIGGAWDLRALLAAHPELTGKVGTALLPAGPGGDRDSFAGGSHLVVFSGTKKEALARRYVDFLLDPARVAAFTTKIGFLPGARDALSAATPPDPLYQPFSAQLDGHSRTYPPTREWGGFEADGLFTSAVQQVMAGKRTAAAAMAGVARTMDDAFGG